MNTSPYELVTRSFAAWLKNSLFIKNGMNIVLFSIVIGIALPLPIIATTEAEANRILSRIKRERDEIDQNPITAKTIDEDISRYSSRVSACWGIAESDVLKEIIVLHQGNVQYMVSPDRFRSLFEKIKKILDIDNKVYSEVEVGSTADGLYLKGSAGSIERIWIIAINKSGSITLTIFGQQINEKKKQLIKKEAKLLFCSK